jgi:hypothetical protein
VIQEPIQPTRTPTSPRARRASGIWIGLVIAACLLLAVPVVVAMAAGSATTSSTSALAVAARAPGGPGGAHGPNVGPGAGVPAGPLGPKGGPGGPGGPGKGPITISSISISDSQVTLSTEDGWTRTITVTSSTVITKGGQTITVGGLSLHDEIRFRQIRNADGSFSITAIDVVVPKVGGEVTAVDGNNITIKQKGGTTRVITVTPATVYKLGPAPGSQSDVKVGTDIDALGTVSGSTFTATSVRIKLAHAGGQVTAKTTDSITVLNRDGTRTVIHVTGSTTYKVKGKDPAALTDIALGDRVNAEGTRRPNGSLDAVAVHGGPPKAEKAPKAPAGATTPS